MDFVSRHLLMQEINEALTRSCNEDPNFASDLDEALERVLSAAEELPRPGAVRAAGREKVLDLAVACLRALEPGWWEGPGKGKRRGSRRA